MSDDAGDGRTTRRRARGAGAACAVAGLARPCLVVVIAVCVVVVAGLAVPPGAAADPIVPPGASPGVRALAEANARAAAATEAATGAREQLAVRQREADRTRRDAADARRGANRARAEKDRAFVGVDRLTRAVHQGGQLDPLSALLGSDSAHSYVEKVALLDTVSETTRAAVQRFTDAAAAAQQAERTADSRSLDAERSAADARRAVADAGRRRSEADRDVAIATTALRRAPAADRAALRSGGTIAFPTSIAGSGIAVDALRVALTQQGKPYVWGANGPSTYDCSGLVQWAYRQIGVALPKYSGAQAEVGRPVASADARPGDLLFFNDPVSHVGIYVGGGRFLEAPQSGDVVKVSTVRSNLTSIRRVAP